MTVRETVLMIYRMRQLFEPVAIFKSVAYDQVILKIATFIKDCFIFTKFLL